jgi:sugar/nucleoside kinase (ribokinase family)
MAFFDLADPEKRTKEDIFHAMKLIGKFEQKFRTILGLNEKELYEIAAVFDVAVDDKLSSEEKLAKTIKTVYDCLGIYCLVVHPVKSASCCIGGEVFHVDGPYCAKPVLTTGAGDNFNAGFCLGQTLGLTPLQSLTLGVSTSGYYVRNAKSPTFEDVIGFVGDWKEGKIV